jgi:hypothetical protein
MGCSCSRLIHLCVSILILSGEEEIIAAPVPQFSASSSSSLSRRSDLSPRYPVLKHPQFLLFPQALACPLFKGGFLMLSWNRFPRVQTILFTGAVGSVYCFHGNLCTSFTYKTLRIVFLILALRTWPFEFADPAAELYISGFRIH